MRPFSATRPAGRPTPLGRITVDSVPSGDTIQLALHFEGVSNSRTSSYRKPVCIWNTGETDFQADANLTFSKDDFQSSGASATADTETTIRSISKTGGNVGRKLVEKIAWKKACQLKPCAEQEGIVEGGSSGLRTVQRAACRGT